jgi:hypothetical protein
MLDLSVDVGLRPLGAYSVTAAWDPRLLRLETVSGGTAAEFQSLPTQNIDNTGGTAHVAAQQAVRLDRRLCRTRRLQATAGREATFRGVRSP